MDNLGRQNEGSKESRRLIYLVHNDSEVLLSLYDALTASGFQVIASSNALDALAYIARSKPRAILCRWEMSEMDGLEFIRRARQLSPSAQIILCSRVADGRMFQQIISSGGTDLIQEPMSATTVLHAVSRLFGMGVPYESSGTATYELDSRPAERHGEVF